MQKWFCVFGGVARTNLIYRLHIHETADIEYAKKNWSEILDVDPSLFRVTIKRNNSSFRKNQTRNKMSEYKGLVSVKVRKSTNFNRTIAYWIAGLSDQLLQENL